MATATTDVSTSCLEDLKQGIEFYQNYLKHIQAWGRLNLENEREHEEEKEDSADSSMGRLLLILNLLQTYHQHEYSCENSDNYSVREFKGKDTPLDVSSQTSVQQDENGTGQNHERDKAERNDVISDEIIWDLDLTDNLSSPSNPSNPEQSVEDDNPDEIIWDITLDNPDNPDNPGMEGDVAVADEIQWDISVTNSESTDVNNPNNPNNPGQPSPLSVFDSHPVSITSHPLSDPALFAALEAHLEELHAFLYQYSQPSTGYDPSILSAIQLSLPPALSASRSHLPTFLAATTALKTALSAPELRLVLNMLNERSGRDLILKRIETDLRSSNRKVLRAIEANAALKQRVISLAEERNQLNTSHQHLVQNTIDLRSFLEKALMKHFNSTTSLFGFGSSDPKVYIKIISHQLDT